MAAQHTGYAGTAGATARSPWPAPFLPPAIEDRSVFALTARLLSRPGELPRFIERLKGAKLIRRARPAKRGGKSGFPSFAYPIVQQRALPHVNLTLVYCGPREDPRSAAYAAVEVSVNSQRLVADHLLASGDIAQEVYDARAKTNMLPEETLRSRRGPLDVRLATLAARLSTQARRRAREWVRSQLAALLPSPSNGYAKYQRQMLLEIETKAIRLERAVDLPVADLPFAVDALFQAAKQVLPQLKPRRARPGWNGYVGKLQAAIEFAIYIPQDVDVVRLEVRWFPKKLKARELEQIDWDRSDNRETGEYLRRLAKHLHRRFGRLVRRIYDTAAIGPLDPGALRLGPILRDFETNRELVRFILTSLARGPLPSVPAAFSARREKKRFERLMGRLAKRDLVCRASKSVWTLNVPVFVEVLRRPITRVIL